MPDWIMGALAAQDDYKPLPWGSDPWVNRLGPTPEMKQQAEADAASRVAAQRYREQQLANADETQAYRGTPRLDPGLRREPGDIAMTPAAQMVGDIGGELLTDPTTYIPGALAAKFPRTVAAATMSSVFAPTDAEAGLYRYKFLPHQRRVLDAKGNVVKMQNVFDVPHWIGKYDEVKPYMLGDEWHNYSALRTGKDLDQMSYQIADPVNLPVNKFDIADLQRQKASLIFGVADRTATGGRVTHIGGRALTEPVEREGGIAYPMMHANTPVAGAPEGARRAFANAQGAASGINNLALEELQKGRTPYFVPLTMGKASGDSALPVARAALDVARQSDPSKEALDYINGVMRARELAAGKKALPGYMDFPGLMHDDAYEWLMTAGGPARSALMKALDTGQAKMGGVADMGEVRVAMTDPRLLRTPTGSGGRTVVKMAPELGTSRDSLHSTYPVAFMAQRPSDIGGLQGSVPWHLLARDTHRGLMRVAPDDPVKYAERGPDYIMRGVPEGVPRVQKVDAQLVDKVSKFFEEHPQGW